MKWGECRNISSTQLMRLQKGMKNQPLQSWVLTWSKPLPLTGLPNCCISILATTVWQQSAASWDVAMSEHLNVICQERHPRLNDWAFRECKSYMKVFGGSSRFGPCVHGDAMLWFEIIAVYVCHRRKSMCWPPKIRSVGLGEGLGTKYLEPPRRQGYVLCAIITTPQKSMLSILRQTPAGWVVQLWWCNCYKTTQRNDDKIKSGFNWASAECEQLAYQRLNHSCCSI